MEILTVVQFVWLAQGHKGKNNRIHTLAFWIPSSKLLSSIPQGRLDKFISKIGENWVTHQEDTEIKTIHDFWKQAISKSHLEFDFGNHLCFPTEKMAKSQASVGKFLLLLLVVCVVLGIESSTSPMIDKFGTTELNLQLGKFLYNSLPSWIHYHKNSVVLRVALLFT